jgi:hypothetical protein
MEAVVDYVSPAVEEDPVKTDWKSSLVKGLLQRGFFGSRTISPSSLEVKEASSSTLADREDSSTFSQERGPLRAETG